MKPHEATTLPHAPSSPRKDVYQIVTERIIAQLEKGTVPWRQPWTDAGIPRNLISRRPYRGINLILLSMLGYEQNLFLTHNQLQQLGGRIRQGEHAHMAVYWNCLEISEQDPDADSARSRKKKVPYMRYHMVYNVGQCEGIPAEKLPTVVRQTSEFSCIEACEDIVTNMPQPPHIRHGKEQRAFYNPLHDYVNMPRFYSFESAESYYATLFHELTHATGHSSRLNRKDILHMQEFDERQAYSLEELVAEIGSCCLLSHAGIAIEFEQSADYIKGWLKVLGSDKRFIFSAATQAQHAADYILDMPLAVIANEASIKPDIPVGLLFVFIA